MSKRIGIFGTSGMARETRDIAADLGLSVVFIAKDSHEMEAFDEDEEVIAESDVERFGNLPCAIGIGDGAMRKKIATRYGRTVRFMTLIHPSATFGRQQREHVEHREGVIVCAGVRFSSNISVGNFAIFNFNSTISHDCIIDDFTTISPQACLLGNIELKSGAWLGAGAVVNQGTNEFKRVIGENTIIGSGAVVLDSCDPNSVYVGIPAKKISAI